MIPREIIFEISTTKGVRLVERYLSIIAHIQSFFFFFLILIRESVKSSIEFLLLS
jgi:hypothetical protein